MSLDRARVRRDVLAWLALRAALFGLAFVHSFPARKHLGLFFASPTIDEAWKGFGAALAVILYLVPPHLHARALGALWRRRRVTLAGAGWILAVVHAVPACDHLPRLLDAFTFADAWRGIGSLAAAVWFVTPIPRQAWALHLIRRLALLTTSRQLAYAALVTTLVTLVRATLRA